MVRRARRAASASRGHTAAEMMMVVAILGVIVVVAAPSMRGMTNFWLQSTARSDIQKDVRVSLDNVNRFLRQAKAGTVQIDQKTGQPPYSRIGFTTYNGVRYTFWQDNNAFMMNTSSGTASITTKLSNRLGYLAFSYPRTDDTSIISVAVTMQAPTYLSNTKTLQLSIQKIRVMNE